MSISSLIPFRLKLRDRAGGQLFDAEVVGSDGAGFLWMPRGSDSREIGRVSLAEPRVEVEDDASSSGGSAISAADVADLTDSVMQEEPAWEVSSHRHPDSCLF